MPRKRKADEDLNTFYIDPGDIAHRDAVAVVERVKGSRVIRQTATLAAPEPVAKPEPIIRDFDDIQAILGNGPDIENLANSDEVIEHYIQAPGERRANKKSSGQYATTVHDQVLQDWIAKGHRETALRELLRLEGWRGISRDRCSACPATRNAVPCIRCDDCWGSEVLCVDCCVRKHEEHPLHRIKRWNGDFFERVTLQSLGLVVQLGHERGTCCPNPAAAPLSFLIMHTNGFHPVTIQFCLCNQARQAGNCYEQLLRAELLPSTTVDPSTCCTFRMLEQFHLLTLQSKITAYDYYTTLTKLTDNTRIGKTYDRLKPFLRMVRQWRHLKMHKRAGRGHYPDGPNTTGLGELCITCPACPDPKVNLPDNWETVSDDMKYLYTMVVAIDANFRLRRRAISNEARDPSLASGCGYFVADTPYRNFLKDRVDETEISTCTGFAALLANNKYTKGYATTGVVAAVDARHGFLLPNGIGDLQKAERYCNVDYVVGAAWHLLPQCIQRVFSYDIACQWRVHLAARLAELPEHVRFELPTGNDLRYAIPKFHFRAHKHENHDQFSFNFMHGVGRVDGEEIERHWSRHNMVAYSTREMGPGSRHDTLEDHFAFANWQKFIGIGDTLKRRLKDSTVEKLVQDRVYTEFCEQLQPENVATWLEEVTQWEQDTTKPSPYHIPSSGLTEAEVKKQLLEEDSGVDAMTEDDGDNQTTAGAMLVALLNVEDQQYKFRMRFPRQADTQPLRTAEVLNKRRNLLRRIEQLRVLQAAYMPVVPQLVARRRRQLGASEDLPEEETLYFPSGLSGQELDLCSPGISEIEERLREGQMHDALDKLRVQLHIKTRMVTFKDRNVRNQASTTRARSMLKANDTKVWASVEKYRKAREAKLAIAGRGDWETKWRVLRDEDVRTMTDDPGLPITNVHGQPVASGSRNTTEGRRKATWIWMSADSTQGEEGLNHAVRVEFLKARARCHRWTEEIRLVKAEQTRVFVSLEKEALQWESRVLSAHEQDESIREGMGAYAREQATLRRRLSQHFAKLWSMPITEMGLLTIDDDGREDDDGLIPMPAEERAEPTVNISELPDSDSDDLGLQSDTDSEF